MPTSGKPKLPILPLVATVFPWLGGGLLLLAAVVALLSWRSTLGLVRTRATVTENVEVFAPGGGIVYQPRLRFQTGDGQMILVLSHQGDDDVEFEAGKVVPVIYPAGDPQAARIATIWRIYAAAIWLAVIGTIVFDVGLVVRRLRAMNTASGKPIAETPDPRL